MKNKPQPTVRYAQVGLLSCLVQSPEGVIPIIEEFAIDWGHFDGIEQDIFVHFLNGGDGSEIGLAKPIEDLRNFLPSANNARYYAERFYEHLQESEKI